MPIRMSWCVYILRCRDGSLYTGITNDLPRRLQQHNAGTASRCTRARLPVRLAYQEEHPNRSSASIREAAIKAMPRVKKKLLIAGGNRRPAFGTDSAPLPHVAVPHAP